MFACYPDDTITRLDQIKPFQENKQLHKYDELSKKIQGHIVEFPAQFLIDEDLKFRRSDKEFYVPDINFT